jgi:hypothetical protein
MKQNVMCISVRRDITSVGIYGIEIINKTEVSKINVNWYEEIKQQRMNEVSKRVVEISKLNAIDGCVIECIGSGIALVDYLKSEDGFTTEIYKVLNRADRNSVV